MPDHLNHANDGPERASPNADPLDLDAFPSYGGGMTKTYAPLQPKGTFTVTVFGRPITLTGGPYRAIPKGYVGIKMAKEIEHPCHYSIPTPDFQTPDPDLVVETAVEASVDALVYRRSLYVGCMAGQGRTGLFLASMAALTGETDPVIKVRAEYYPHAVETEKQEAFVAAIAARSGEFRRRLMRQLVRHQAVDAQWRREMSWKDWFLWLRVRLVGA